MRRVREAENSKVQRRLSDDPRFWCVFAAVAGTLWLGIVVPAGAGFAGSLGSPQSPTTESTYRQRLEQNPNDVEALAGLARLTVNQSNCSQSIDYARRGLLIAPSDRTCS
jgi:hypothetical protein